MIKKVIMLHAHAQSGKNTCADIMEKFYKDENKRAIIIAFGDYVKYTLDKYYHIKDFKSKEGRSLIQQYATDKIRNQYNEYFWADIVTNFLAAIKEDFDIAIIPDWRFNNEYTSISEKFEVIPILIRRPNYKEIDNMTNEQRNHQSETELDNSSIEYAFTIVNEDNNLKNTEDQIKKILKEINC